MHSFITKLFEMAGLALVLASCSSQQMYATGQYLQRVQCLQQVDQTTQARCLSAAELPYEAYEQAQRQPPAN